MKHKFFEVQRNEKACFECKTCKIRLYLNDNGYAEHNEQHLMRQKCQIAKPPSLDELLGMKS